MVNRQRRPKAKQASKAVVKSTRAPRRPDQTSQIAHKVCGLTDPFCIHADGARWSDQVGNVSTITYQSRILVNVQSNSSGDAAVYFDPAYAMNSVNPGAYHQALTVTAGAVTAANPTTVGDATLASLLASSVTTGARVVSAGATWWDTVAATGAGGSVIATEVPNYKAYTNTPGTFSSTQATLSANVMVMDRRKHGSWISRPSNPAAYNFLNSQDSDDLYQEVRTALILCVTGPPSLTVIKLELVVNFEFTVTLESIYGRIAKPNPSNASNLLAARVAGKVESAMQPFFEGGKTLVGRAIATVATRAARAALTAAGAYLGGPSGAVVGYHAIDVD
jgi:hypothetical protein